MRREALTAGFTLLVVAAVVGSLLLYRTRHSSFANGLDEITISSPQAGATLPLGNTFTVTLAVTSASTPARGAQWEIAYGSNVSFVSASYTCSGPTGHLNYPNEFEQAPTQRGAGVISGFPMLTPLGGGAFCASADAGFVAAEVGIFVTLNLQCASNGRTPVILVKDHPAGDNTADSATGTMLMDGSWGSITTTLAPQYATPYGPQAGFDVICGADGTPTRTPTATATACSGACPTATATATPGTTDEITISSAAAGSTVTLGGNFAVTLAVTDSMTPHRAVQWEIVYAANVDFVSVTHSCTGQQPGDISYADEVETVPAERTIVPGWKGLGDGANCSSLSGPATTQIGRFVTIVLRCATDGRTSVSLRPKGSPANPTNDSAFGTTLVAADYSDIPTTLRPQFNAPSFGMQAGFGVFCTNAVPAPTGTATPAAINTRTLTPTATAMFAPTATPTPCMDDDVCGPNPPGPDGIDANIDVDPAHYSDYFSDLGLGGTTSGRIVNRDGLTIHVSDAANPNGVEITVSGVGGPAQVSICSNPASELSLSPGDDVIETCHSAVTQVISGPVVVRFGTILAELPTGTTATATQPSPGVVSVVNDAVSTSAIIVGGASVPSGATSPSLVDSDGDGLIDSVETNTGTYVGPSDTGTNPNVRDSDGDGASDGEEVFITHSSPFIRDSDADGCADGREYVGTNADHRLGGDRDPLSPYDFFDVPVPALLPSNTTGVQNKAITINDVLAIVTYIGTSAANPNTPNGNGATYGSDYNNNGVPDGQEYDRTPGVHLWAPGPPNGAVTINDALIALNSIGDNCN